MSARNRDLVGHGKVFFQIVEKMSQEEKLKLKEEIANSVPKDVRELLGDRVIDEDDLDAEDQDRELGDIVEEEEEHHNDVIAQVGDEEAADTVTHPAAGDCQPDLRDVSKRSSPNVTLSSAGPDISVTSIVRVEETPDVSRMSDKKRVSDVGDDDDHLGNEAEVVLDEVAFQQKRPPVPLPRTLTPQKPKQAEEKPTTSVRNLTPSTVGAETKNPPPKRRYFKTPEALKTPSYLKPTTASQQRASPRKGDTW